MGFIDWLFSTKKSENRISKKRVFISFAIEDSIYRNYLVDQARKPNSPFDLIDMSVKQPWDEAEWKKMCRSKIKRCHYMIVLLSKNTWKSKGSRWEMRCAKEENVRLIGMHIKKNDKGGIPPELTGCRIIEWSWANLERYLK